MPLVSKSVSKAKELKALASSREHDKREYTNLIPGPSPPPVFDRLSACEEGMKTRHKSITYICCCSHTLNIASVVLLILVLSLCNTCVCLSTRVYCSSSHDTAWFKWKFIGLVLQPRHKSASARNAQNVYIRLLKLIRAYRIQLK